MSARQAVDPRLAVCTACGGSGLVKVKRAVMGEVAPYRADGRAPRGSLTETIADACPGCARLAEAEYQAEAADMEKKQA